MTYEDVKRIRANPTLTDVDNEELARMIDEAIEKQIPKKPDAQQTAKNDCWDCPTCGSLTKDMWSHSHDWDNGYSVGHKDGYQQGRKDTIDELNGIIAESVRMMWHDATTMPKIKEWLDKQIKEQKNE